MGFASRALGNTGFSPSSCNDSSIEEDRIRARVVDGWLGRLLTLSPSEATFRRRGFHDSSEAARARLEGIGVTFIAGYNAALAATDSNTLARRLERISMADRGFAYEGAAMALTLLDLLTPWRKDRFAELLAGPGREHAYMVHVGAGWALARLGRGSNASLPGLDPLLRWLAFDGYGFHEGYFHSASVFEKQVRPRQLRGYALRAFDQGLGRSLWFAEGADVKRISSTVTRFPIDRQGDLWSGLGLAAAYAGGVEERDLALLRELAEGYNPHLAQGAAFAAKARERARGPAPHTDLACRILCGGSASVSAEVTDDALKGLRGDADLPDYEIWRSRIRDRYSTEASIT